MGNNNHRLLKYRTASTSLTCLSNQQLKQILADAKPLHEGIGGKSILIFIDELPVFVKKVPLTEREQLPQNFMSTANLFNLPLYYQYGVGSAGFGAWRELASHIMTTNWVLTGECGNFPIIYHWRILPSEPSDINLHYWGDLEKYYQYWENSKSIQERVTALNQAPAYIALFLEYVPQNLYEWLKFKLIEGGNSADAAIAFVDEELQATNRYMNAHQLLHFDAHFSNILTDGKRLYISDFGLAISSKFDLSQAEREFLKQHHSYGQACAAVNLLHCIITSLSNEKPWEMQLRKYLVEELSNTSSSIKSIIKKYAPLALIMDEFFQKLQKESKSTPYPKIQLEKLLTSFSSL